jgi:uncharacterized protein (TIGR03083 family)
VVELQTYVDHVRRDGALLLAAVQSDPTAPVPSCPEWDTTALLGHTGKVHHWVAHILGTGATERPARQFGKEIPEGFDACASWYETGVAELINAFAATDPDGLVWNWGANRPASARWWFRRMAQETTIHRWDAQAAVDRADDIDGELAADGIDEYLGFVVNWLRSAPIEGFEGSLSLSPTDRRDAWHLHLASDRLERRDDAKTQATISAPVSDLYLWLVHRASVDSPELKVEGARSAVSMWDLITFE